MIHGEPKGEMDEDSRNSPPPAMEVGLDEVDIDENPLGRSSSEPHEASLGASSSTSMGAGPQSDVHVTMNLLSVVPKEKPPLNVVGDVHGRIAIIVVT